MFGAQGRAVTQILFEHGNLIAALGAARSGAVNAGGFLHRDLEVPVRVRAKLLKQRIQLGLELRPGTGAAHGALHAHLECDFFELFTVLVLAVVYRVHQLVGQGVNDLKCAGKRGRDKDLVDFIGRAFFRPALADVSASYAGACKAAGHLAVRNYKVLGGKHGAQCSHSGL